MKRIPTMPTTQLARAAAKRSDVTPATAYRVLLSALAIIEEELSAGHRVTLLNLGSFGVKTVQSRMLAGRVPARRIPARILPAFTFTPAATVRLRREVQL